MASFLICRQFYYDDIFSIRTQYLHFYQLPECCCIRSVYRQPSFSNTNYITFICWLLDELSLRFITSHFSFSRVKQTHEQFVSFILAITVEKNRSSGSLCHASVTVNDPNGKYIHTGQVMQQECFQHLLLLPNYFIFRISLTYC